MLMHYWGGILAHRHPVAAARRVLVDMSENRIAVPHDLSRHAVLLQAGASAEVWDAETGFSQADRMAAEISG